MKKKYIPDHVPALKERQEYIIGRRLDGAPADTLARELGVSKECVCKSIRGLPKRSYAESCKSSRNVELKTEVIKEVCMKYLSGSTEKDLMHDFGLTKKELYDCFYAVTDRIAAYSVSGKKYPYSSIEKARHRRNVSLRQLLGAVEMPGYKNGQNFNAFTSIIRGWEFMPFDVATMIAEMLGLPISEICADVMELNFTELKPESACDELAVMHFLELAEAENKTPEQQEALAWVMYRARKELGVIF